MLNRILFFFIVFSLFSNLLFAEISRDSSVDKSADNGGTLIISPEYSHYANKKTFQQAGGNILYMNGNHLLMAQYQHNDNLNRDYKNLESSLFGYSYNNDDIRIFASVFSSSDKIFGSKDVVDSIGLIGYNVFNTDAFNGQLFVYLGVVGSTLGAGTTNFMDGYILPYVSIGYNSDNVDATVGFPEAEVTVRVTPKHSLKIITDIFTGVDIFYTFEMDSATKLNIHYSNEQTYFTIQKEALNEKYKDKTRYVYSRQWIGGGISKFINNTVEVKLDYAYQLNGYVYHGKLKDFEKSPRNRLPYTNKVSAGLSFYF